jgi:hypothetical protein
MRKESGRSMRGLVIIAMVAFLVIASSIYLGSPKLSRQIVVLSLVSLTCYVLYEYGLVRVLYSQIHLRRTRAASDSLELRKKVWDDIALFERRVGMVLLVVLLIFAGSAFEGLIGIGLSLLLALAITGYARKSRII